MTDLAENGSAPGGVRAQPGASTVSEVTYNTAVTGQGRAVAYCRVSTPGQVEDGYGLDVQDASVRAWCANAGVELVAVYRDEGISGAKEVADRPGLADAVAAVVDRCAEMLVIPRLDRLARSLTVQEAVLSEVWKAGGTVIACDVGEIARDDPDDPMRTFFRQVMGAVSELERSMIRARTRAGRRRKLELGGYGGGAPPFGWLAVDGELEPLDSEQVVIARARELHSGRTLRQVAAALNAEGLTTRRGSMWRSEQVRRLLRR